MNASLKMLTWTCALIAVVLGLPTEARAHEVALHLNTAVSLPMGAYQLDGTTRPPAIGYQVGVSIMHLIVNEKVYDVSLQGLAFGGLTGALSIGAAPCIGNQWCAVCVGFGIDLRDPDGHGVFDGFTWARNSFLLAGMSIPLPDRGHSGSGR